MKAEQIQIEIHHARESLSRVYIAQGKISSSPFHFTRNQKKISNNNLNTLF